MDVEAEKGRSTVEPRSSNDGSTMLDDVAMKVMGSLCVKEAQCLAAARGSVAIGFQPVRR